MVTYTLQEIGSFFYIKKWNLSFTQNILYYPTVRDVENLINKKIEDLGVIVTMYSRRIKKEKEIYEALENEYKVIGIIKRTTQTNIGIYEGKPAVLVAPKSDVAQEYHKIAKYIIEN